MKRVEEYSNWCHFDRLDGKDLQDGEVLRVKFPDGSVSEGPVYVKKSSYTVSDHGLPWEVPVSRAYWRTYTLGVVTDVPLKGLEAERVTK